MSVIRKTSESAVSPANIPIFILAGGMGTRISEETTLRPKPMVEIGSIPVLVHLMRFYCSYGFNDFVICGGYRALDIKEYLLGYRFTGRDLEIDQRDPEQVAIGSIGTRRNDENWRVRVIDTGLNAMTGARIARAYDVVNELSPISCFGVTYGDGLSDVNLLDELEYHFSHGAVGTVLGVTNPARFGELDVKENDDRVAGFLEKPESKHALISAGFFFFSSKFRDYLDTEENVVLEREPLSALARDGQLRVHRHKGFSHPMDTLRDRNYLQSVWDSGKAPWVRRAEENGRNDIRHWRDRSARRRAG